MSGNSQTFSSRWVMILAMLSMAVGTGNIWRFPRIAAENGGGTFLIPWMVFLFLWSIPLILVEFGLGRMSRSGPPRTFGLVMGPRWVWMGAFVAFVSTAIMFYYSVVTGWTLRYVWASFSGELPGSAPGVFWNSFVDSWWPAAFHGISVCMGVLVVSRGVSSIERVAKVLMPVLMVLIGLLAIRAVTLPGASEGLKYLFTVDWSRLGNARVWVEALTQNAWDTGAGWGLVLTYAAYLRSQEDTALNAFIVPAANNLISLLAGVTVICTVFSVVPSLAANFSSRPETLQAFPALADAVGQGQELSPRLFQETIFGAGNEGLTFVWMPELFQRLPLGNLLTVFFFIALSFAAFTSLVAMIELATRVFVDAGVARRRAIRFVWMAAFFLGLPSAVSIQFLHNQDWVWAVGLMLSGLFFAVAVIRHGAAGFRKTQLNHEHSDMRIGKWWDILITLVVPAEALLLTGWWLYQSYQWARRAWLDPFAVDNVGTVFFQFTVVLGTLALLNRWIAGRSLGSK